jgi:SAM-dependent methyltransferase
MDDEALSRWFDENRNILETAYTAATEPWQQSGVGLHTPHIAHDWEVLRKPIAECVTASGAFLDIGCANGYLLECMLRWTADRGLSLIPYGLDFSKKLVALARQRLPSFADHIFLGNAWDWQPPRQFDYINITLYYVPDELRKTFVHRLLDRYVQPSGRLLIAEYLGRSTGMPTMRIDEELRSWGFRLETVISSHLEHDAVHQTRVAVIRKSLE